ncbi:Chaperone DnaJ-domain superfamily protein [Rhynchospora pubera]|uniref:Chaperone DnaJ-domain superfamily protein n=1 Tax=Rhynchospora pubera TaxID=906938 RepID=A0AAV8E0V5_9POAL|nr:Chaperone DnaJ-domain superfamily protein [Rhynchospora pubera]
MDDMSGILARDFGIRPQGKAAPMAASKTASTYRSTPSSSAWTNNASPSPSPSYDDFFTSAASSAPANSRSTVNQPHDPILDTFNKGPVFDTPVYDDDIFDGVPGVRSSSTNMRFDDVFGSGPSDRTHVDSPPAYDDLLGSLGSKSGRLASPPPPPYDDFLGGLGTTDRKDDKDQGSVKTKAPSGLSGFDDLLPGFGSSVPPPQPKRENPETDLPKPPKPASNVQDDPFSVFETVTSTPSVPSSGLFSDPLDEFTRPAASGPTKVDSSPIADNLFSENSNSFEPGQSHNGREKSPDLNGSFREKVNPKISARDTSPMGSFNKKGTDERSPLDNYEIPMGQAGHRSMGSDSFSRNQKLVEDPSPESSENSEMGEDIWLTVSEIPLFTRPTSAPPPSRPPPPLTVKGKPGQNYSFNRDSSPVDDLENFAMGKPPSQKFEYDEGEMERSSAAMKDAMDKAQAKFRHAKEVREKMRSKEAEQLERDDSEREMAEKEREEREREERERERERRRMEREEEERRRKEKEEREKARLAVERATREARERAANDARLRAERAAVLRAQQEARERAAADARERAAAEAKEKAEREVREKAAAAAAMERERAEREAREKASAERLEREKVEKDRQARSQRAAVERAAAEARERLAQAARERHQQQSQAQQRRPDPVQQRRPDPPQQQRAPEDDLESFFGSRANSAPRPARPAASTGSSTNLNRSRILKIRESLFETQTQTKGPDASRRAASVSGASIPKASSVNMMDDLSAIFGGAAPSSSGGDFQEIEGESEERRQARLERHKRTEERARKALQEKNERDMQAQREQAERHRIAESMDFEIKRWAAGKEGNLRALLGSLHYILWQECGWQPVSMADLITGAAVKKVYRKATLCIHPDKVQQKGATLQQKYIAEKVFDILKAG